MQNFVVRSGRADLAVSMAGEGTAVVFLHAGVADRRMWWSQLAMFSASHCVIAYDRRGFGETRYKSEPHNLVQDLDAVLETVGIERAVLVGCSQGGRIAIDYALTYPERTEGLILVAPAISGAPAVSEYPDRIQRLFDEMELAERNGDVDWQNKLEAHAWLDGPAEDEGRVSGSVRELFLDMNALALRASAPGKETGVLKAYARLAELEMPVEIVSGELDFPHINERNKHLRSTVRRGHLTVMPAVAHLPSLEAPAKFNTLLRRLLRRYD
jgi:pimeloyl-ACP methyl ester carboxylesterase